MTWGLHLDVEEAVDGRWGGWIYGMNLQEPYSGDESKIVLVKEKAVGRTVQFYKSWVVGL